MKNGKDEEKNTMHFHPILLVQAESLQEAKEIAESFCECECSDHALFDYGGVVPDEESDWNKPLNEVKDKLPKDDHLEEAARLLVKANNELEQGNYGMAGYYYRKAGELYSQCFCTEHPVFNVQYNDYSRNYNEGWYAIEADLHF
jgi:hypothetical protein